MSKTVSKSVKFWDRFAHKYSLGPIAKPQIYEKKLEMTRQYLKPGMDVLEFGCGTGSTAILHAPHVKHFKATDYSQNMIAIGKQKALYNNIQNITFECAEVMDLDPQKEQYDVILGLNVLHLLQDKEAVLRKVHCLLKPGGVFVSSTACLEDHVFLKYLKYIAPLGHFLGLIPFVRSFSKNDLMGLHEKIGFKNEVVWSPDVGSLFLVVRKS
ncbi:MAG: class I SAM-dependent methyltransferase [Bdellovibrio sp.]|nr:class I SAM-dependent methyltransferase [Bdellovibrio sp.]